VASISLRKEVKKNGNNVKKRFSRGSFKVC